jgi:two-component system invasion response regulator UvrY
MNTMTTKKTKVFIVEDHDGTREGLRKLIDFENDLSVCGEAATITQGLQGIRNTEPDVAVIDFELGKESGLDLVGKLDNALLKIPVLMLSMYPETLYAKKSLQRGARGYLMKSETPDQILFALREVASGNVYLSPVMTKQLNKQGDPFHE